MILKLYYICVGFTSIMWGFQACDSTLVPIPNIVFPFVIHRDIIQHIVDFSLKALLLNMRRFSNGTRKV